MKLDTALHAFPRKLHTYCLGKCKVIVSGEIRLLLYLIPLILLVPACTSSEDVPIDVQPGSSKAEVTDVLGEPDEVSEFTLPAEPFFGPQEGLSSAVPAGDVVEQWIYKQGDQVQYVWFWGESTTDQVEWTVVMTATYPADAVF